MIKAEIIKDSTNWTGRRLTTFVLTFPRYILAELNTHRAFSRNSGSSRAIPFKKMVKMVEENPFVPIAWQKDHTGMQGTEYYTAEEVEYLELDKLWLEAKNQMVFYATELNTVEDGTGVTKQLCNRLLEPFMWHTAIITTDDIGLSNFFKQRTPSYEHTDAVTEDNNGVVKYSASKVDYIDVESGGHADSIIRAEGVENYTDWKKINKGMGEIHIMALAEAMWDAYYKSKPTYLVPGEWHLPYVELPQFYDQNYLKDCIKTSVAKCARVSYGRQDVDTTLEEDVKMFDRLVGSEPIHASPTEHQNKVPDENPFRPDNRNYLSNIKGWIQLRKLIESGDFK